jgi:predicted ester cyclase
VAPWGPIPATGKSVSYDEIVVMKVRDGKVFWQRGVSDALLALQQLGAIPDPAGFTRG